MSVQSEIDRIITAVGNAYSKVSEKGGTMPASQTVSNLATAIDSIPAGGAKETWVIKSDAAGEFATTQISFTSNGQKFTSIGAVYDGSVFSLLYGNNEIAIFTPGASSGYEFYNEDYRKLTFDTSPAGALLTWLQSNATKQPDDTAVQDTKSLTITSNGTVSVTPDAPYDGLSSVDVTVNVSGGGGGGEMETVQVVVKGVDPNACSVWDVKKRAWVDYTTGGVTVNVVDYLAVQPKNQVMLGYRSFVRLKDGTEYNCTGDVGGAWIVGDMMSFAVINFAYTSYDSALNVQFHRIKAEDIDHIYISTQVD